MSRRLGKFYIDNYLLESKKIAEMLCAMEFIPLRVECLYYKDSTEYIGVSPLFEEVEPGYESPTYTVLCSTVSNYPNGPGTRLKVEVF